MAAQGWIRANHESPLLGPLREILVVATGPVVVLAEEPAHIDWIESTSLYGSFAARMLGETGPAPHDIRVMVLGEPDVDAAYETCTRAEAAVHWRVNPSILTPEKFAKRSAFLDNVRGGPAARRPGGRGDRVAAVALTPLTRVEQATVVAFVEARRLDVGPADVARATRFLRQAEVRLNQLPLLTSVVVTYGIS